MKMTRNDLKEIVKECLVEILAEGMGNSPSRLKESISSKFHAQQKKAVDVISYKEKRNDSHLDKKIINERIKAESKGDPVLAAILADTAATTLPNMLMNESTNKMPIPAGSVESVVAATNPEQLFGDEAASKWAALAFADVPKKF